MMHNNRQRLTSILTGSIAALLNSISYLKLLLKLLIILKFDEMYLNRSFLCPKYLTSF